MDGNRITEDLPPTALATTYACPSCGETLLAPTVLDYTGTFRKLKGNRLDLLKHRTGQGANQSDLSQGRPLIWTGEKVKREQ